MKDNNKNIKTSKEIRIEQKQAHKREVQLKVEQVLEDPVQKQTTYLNSKKLQWFDYIIIFLVSATLIGIAFLISIFGFKDIAKTEWFTFLFCAITALIWIIIGWYKNKSNAKFYNDRRRRYQTTLTESEAFLKRVAKIVILISLILLVTSIIFIFTLG